MCKCTGCGAKLQDIDKRSIGYTPNINNKLCERCFKIKAYNDYKVVSKDNKDYIDILKDISKKDDLIVLVVDLFNINENLNEISKYIKNDILLVLSKRDILPLSCNDLKLKEYFNNYDLNILDKIVISSKKNYNFDLLFDKINKYKKTNNVYIVGYTNSGKSTMINKIIYNYSSLDANITTSNLPSTTIDLIKININDDLTLIDTPGLLDKGDIINYVNKEQLKKIIPTKEIKPITYQVKNKQSIFLESLARIDINNKTNLTIYTSNKLNMKRIYSDTLELKNLKKREFDIDENCDLVIQGLGFINFKNKANICVYIDEKVNVFIRKGLI